MKKIFILSLCLLTLKSFGQDTSAIKKILKESEDKIKSQKFDALQTKAAELQKMLSESDPNYRKIRKKTLRLNRELDALAPVFGTNENTGTVKAEQSNASDSNEKKESELKPKKETKTPLPTSYHSLTYLNGVNFDFDGNSNTNYVGILNYFAPDQRMITKQVYLLGFNKITLGVNVGMMKINFFKRGDSINTVYNIEQHVLIHPLDSTIVGKKYLRQYNKISSTYKNTTYSIYLQPLFRFYDDDRNKKIIFYLHLHEEFFISKWSSTITSTNLQQDTAYFKKNNEVSNPINKFTSSNNSLISSYIQVTTSCYTGVGITAIVKPTPEVTIILQPTWGKVFNYGAPEPINSITLHPKFSDENINNFFLTRAYMKYQFVSGVEGVVGLDIRGKKFGTVQPLYAMFFGINIGLDGLSNLFK